MIDYQMVKMWLFYKNNIKNSMAKDTWKHLTHIERSNCLLMCFLGCELRSINKSKELFNDVGASDLSLLPLVDPKNTKYWYHLNSYDFHENPNLIDDLLYELKKFFVININKKYNEVGVYWEVYLRDKYNIKDYVFRQGFLIEDTNRRSYSQFTQSLAVFLLEHEILPSNRER